MSYSDSEVRDNVKNKFKKKLHVQLKAKQKIATPEVVKTLKRQLRPVLDELHLLAAVNTNNVYEVERLLEAAVSPNLTDIQSRSVLHIAVSKGYTDIVRILLQHGADPNKKDAIHNTPLHLAACAHNMDIISLLIEAGADVSSPDIHGRHPLQLAKSKLQILQKSWREGAIEMVQLKSEIKQIINLMISVWNRKHLRKNISSQANLDNLELMKLSINQGPDVEMDEQMSKLLVELQGFQIT